MNKLNWIKIESTYLPTEEDMKKTENKLDFQFPSDYIEVMKEYDGAFPDVRTFDLEEDEDCVNNLLSFDETSKQSILFAYEVVCGRGNKNLYPIARDPFGNYICYEKMDSDKTGIVFWDHENPQKAEKICDSFSEFLNLLYE